MKPFPVFIAAWALTGLGAVFGSILGNSLGKSGLVAGALIGGVAGIGATVVLVSRFRWLPKEDRRGAFVGGVVGFAIAAPIAVANLSTPVTPILICALVGAGLLLGVGIARGWRGIS